MPVQSTFASDSYLHLICYNITGGCGIKTTTVVVKIQQVPGQAKVLRKVTLPGEQSMQNS